MTKEREKAFPVRLGQQLPAPSKPKAQAGQKKRQGKRGRPKGSSNKDKTQVNLNAELRLIRGMIESLLTADTDLRLCRFFRLPEGYFLRLQNAYETMEAKRKLGEKLKN